MSEARAGVERPAVQVGALALVTVATALAFGRIFTDGGFVPMLLAAALLPHAVGLVGRLRSWSTTRTVTIGIVATVLMLAWIVAGETTAYGLPLIGTAERVGSLLDDGWQIFRTGVAPVPPTTGVVLLCAVAVATSALSADAIARRPGVTIGALAPTLVLLVLTGTLGTHDLRVATTVAYVAAALVALVIANAVRLEARRTWFTGRRLASDATVVRSAALVGGVAILAALVLTPVIPGVDSPALLSYRGSSGTGPGAGLSDYTTVSPLVDLRSRLTERSDTELFRVESPQPLYWRLVALDRFDGAVWSVASEARDAAEVFRDRAAGLPIHRRAVRQRFTVGALTDQWMPAAFAAVGTTIGNARLIPESTTLIAPNSISGQTYEVRSRIEATPTASALAATRTERAIPDAIQPYVELPEDFPASLRAQADAITAGSATPYAAALALQRFFTDGSFTYDLNVDLTDSTEAIGAFLRIKVGFCQQFAGAFAALARAQGLPARVVVGFTPGVPDPTSGEYVVRGRDAHAWAEVWFAGLGWRTFEPTPAGGQPGQAVATADDSKDSGAGPAGAATTTSTLAPTSATTTAAGSPRVPRSETLISTQAVHGDGGWDAPSLALVVVPALVAGMFIAMVLTQLVSRVRVRRRRRRGPEPTERVAGAWSEALDNCAEAGLPVSAALTPREQARAIGTHGAPPDAALALRQLADLYAEFEWSSHAPTPDAGDYAWTAADEVRTALLVGVGGRERTRRVLRATFRNPDDAEAR